MAAPSVVNGYTLGKVIGEGAFSKVYQGTKEGETSQYAIKQVKFGENPVEEKDAYKKEIEILERLTHPNVIKYIANFSEGPELYIVMELADRGDLGKIIKRAITHSAPLEERTIWKIFYQMCAGMKHMHEQRILHRDLKPANIFVGAGGYIKVGDFGLGRIFSDQTLAAKTIVGTILYMSPERINEEPYGLPADVWSLGCILYEMAALHSPFWADKSTLVTVCKAIDNCTYPPLAAETWSEPLRDLIARILVKSADERPTMADLYNVSKKQVKAFSVDTGSPMTPVS